MKMAKDVACDNHIWPRSLQVKAKTSRIPWKMHLKVDKNQHKRTIICVIESQAHFLASINFDLVDTVTMQLLERAFLIWIIAVYLFFVLSHDNAKDTKRRKGGAHFHVLGDYNTIGKLSFGWSITHFPPAVCPSTRNQFPKRLPKKPPRFFGGSRKLIWAFGHLSRLKAKVLMSMRNKAETL